MNGAPKIDGGMDDAIYGHFNSISVIRENGDNETPFYSSKDYRLLQKSTQDRLLRRPALNPLSYRAPLIPAFQMPKNNEAAAQFPKLIQA